MIVVILKTLDSNAVRSPPTEVMRMEDWKIFQPSHADMDAYNFTIIVFKSTSYLPEFSFNCRACCLLQDARMHGSINSSIIKMIDVGMGVCVDKATC